MNKSFWASAIIIIAVIGPVIPKITLADNVDGASCTAETRKSLQEEASRLADAILDNREQWAELMGSAVLLCSKLDSNGGLDFSISSRDSDSLNRLVCETMVAHIDALNFEYQSLIWQLRDIWVRYYPACDPYATCLPHRDGYYINLHSGFPMQYPPEIEGRESPAPPAPPLEIIEAPAPPVTNSTVLPPTPGSTLLPPR